MKVTVFQFPCRARRLLSRRKLWRDCRTRRVYRVSSVGEKDDNLPLAKIESYLAYARAAGNPAPIETVVYPGAHHAWTVPGLVPARFYLDYVSRKNVR
jgi:dienelactone hydrolase